MITFGLHPIRARWLADAMLAALPRMADTPALNGARITVSHDEAPDGETTPALDRIEWLATDRYRIHQIATTVDNELPSEEVGVFTIHKDALRWVVRNANYFRGNSGAFVLFEATFDPDAGDDPAGTVVVRVLSNRWSPGTPELSFTTRMVARPFPPIERIIDETMAAPVIQAPAQSGALRVDHIGQAAKLAVRGDARSPIRWSETPVGKATENPVVLDFSYGTTVARAFIQPMRTR